MDPLREINPLRSVIPLVADLRYYRFLLDKTLAMNQLSQIRNNRITFPSLSFIM